MSLTEAVEPRRPECTCGIFSKFRHDCSTATEPSLASRWPSYEATRRRFEYATPAIAVSFLSAFLKVFQPTSLRYLLSYDALAFQAYIESIIASNSTNAAGNPKHNRSAWLSSDPAHVIFQSARRRCFVSSKIKKPQPNVEEEAWDVLDEVQETSGKPLRPMWLPSNIIPVLEELPKWDLLAETLLEIEGYITNNPISPS